MRRATSPLSPGAGASPRRGLAGSLLRGASPATLSRQPAAPDRRRCRGSAGGAGSCEGRGRGRAGRAGCSSARSGGRRTHEDRQRLSTQRSQVKPPADWPVDPAVCRGVEEFAEVPERDLSRAIDRRSHIRGGVDTEAAQEWLMVGLRVPRTGVPAVAGRVSALRVRASGCGVRARARACARPAVRGGG